MAERRSNASAAIAPGNGLSAMNKMIKTQLLLLVIGA
jgi:hypothetical protein